MVAYNKLKKIWQQTGILIFCMAGLLMSSTLLCAQAVSAVDYTSEHFDLVSINHAFLINLMEDLEAAQKSIPLQDARLDVACKRQSYFTYGLASLFLFETIDNPMGADYQPKGIVSLAPIGLHYPLKDRETWHLGFTARLHWAAFIDKRTLEDITLQRYLKHYPKLAEVAVGLELPALMTFQAGYRKQFWDNSSALTGSFAGINPHRDYNRWYAEINIGLQTRQKVQKRKMSASTTAWLALSYPDNDIVSLYAGDQAELELNLTNNGKKPAYNILLNAANETDLPVFLTLTPETIPILNPGETSTIVLTLTADDKVGHTTNGNIRLSALDAKGNPADCAISVMIEKNPWSE
jgi:hypothetical protein